MKPTMARLTLARKIAAITLIVWKKGVNFDAEHLKQQASACGESIPDSSQRRAGWFQTLWFEVVS